MDESRVDHEKAANILEQAYNKVSTGQYSVCSPFQQEIKQILYGTHLTYRYIMVNALLAKTTNPQINPLCLQKKSSLNGAYDARSLCHNVLVPFERAKLGNALGGSNEPFLNKPARFPELSPNNAVRRGKDMELLTLLCEFLPKINTQQEAFDALTDSLYYLLEISKDRKTIIELQETRVPSYIDIENIINDLLTESFGGECLVLIVGGLMKLFTASLKGETRVEVHVVNQSGSSSKEISDIDVYLENKILYTIEAKDKVFTQEDVTHAVNKVASAGCDRLMFIKGPRASLIGTSEPAVVQKAMESGVYLTFMNHLELMKALLALILPATKGTFFSILRNIAYEARFKEETINHLLTVAKKYDLIK